MDDPRVIDAIVIIYVGIRVVLVVSISFFLLVKAMTFRRAGRFGEALANSNIVVALAYLGTLLLLIGLDFFRSTPWVLGISLAVGVWVYRAAKEMSRLYGGWKPLFHEVRLTLQEYRQHWLAQHPAIRLAQILLFVEFWLAVGLVEVKGLPREWVIPTMLVDRSATPTPAPTRTPSVPPHLRAVVVTIPTEVPITIVPAPPDDEAVDQADTGSVILALRAAASYYRVA